MRIGYAETKFSVGILMVSLCIMSFLAIWAYMETPNSEWRLAIFLTIYFVSAMNYTNIGVWIHEQLHFRAFRGTTAENHRILTLVVNSSFLMGITK